MTTGEQQGHLFVPEATAPPAQVAEVAVCAKVGRQLSYAVPASLDLVPGMRVLVPLGPREVEGFVVTIRAGTAADTNLRPVSASTAATPLLTPTTLALGLWMASHYGAEPGECLQAVVPAPVRSGASATTVRFVECILPHDEAGRLKDELTAKPRTARQAGVLAALLASPEGMPLPALLATARVSESPVQTLARRGALRITERPAEDDGFEAIRPARIPPPELTRDQNVAAEALCAAIRAGAAARFLLHGVTGSGKTEVYLQACEQALSLGRAAIMLVPEIALTPQTVERFRARLGNVAVLHSNQSDSSRARQWELLRSGAVRVALGPRSALFAPFRDVGLIILDEEHETTFKQQNAPRYHARDVALRRCELEGAVLVLGSATPALETEWMVRRGLATRLEMPLRVTPRPLPDVRIIDMRHEKPMGPGGLFSTALYHQAREALARHEQVLLFLNRRGFSTQVLCRRCGWQGCCESCAVNLTYYRGATTLLCHYCGARAAPPTKCPDCGSPEVKYQGSGTERVQEAAMTLFPGRRVERMDGETLQARGSAERLYQALKKHEVDILVGTQVIAKGIDIPGITTIGVIHADTALLIPDFRAAERTFQLLCQVAGRAGRGDRPGRVLIQTYEPQHYAVTCAARHDATRFAEQELEHRRRAGYPPFGFLVRLVFHATDDARAEAAAHAMRVALDALSAACGPDLVLLGPAPCPLNRLQGQFRWHLIARSLSDATIDRLMSIIPTSADRAVRVIVDRDPVSMM